MCRTQMKKYVDINNLKVAPADFLICTGCNYTSYFKFIGKATILNNFFQHASFISGHNTPGCLSNTLPSNKQHGFLSFIRLVGTCYFKKHLSAFLALKGHNTSNHLYNYLIGSFITTREKIQTTSNQGDSHRQNNQRGRLGAHFYISVVALAQILLGEPILATL